MLEVLGDGISATVEAIYECLGQPFDKAEVLEVCLYRDWGSNFRWILCTHGLVGDSCVLKISIPLWLGDDSFECQPCAGP